MSAHIEPPFSIPADCWRQIFGNERPVAVEIGPGRGEFLLASAAQQPERNFFAIERSPARTRALEASVRKASLANVRVVWGDASCLVPMFPAASVVAFHVLFPDPWWKRRHGRRRIMTPRFVAAMRRALVSGGTIELVTDVAEYFAVAGRMLAADPGLVGVADPAPFAISTTFARKADSRGWRIHRSLHQRVA